MLQAFDDGIRMTRDYWVFEYRIFKKAVTNLATFLARRFWWVFWVVLSGIAGNLLIGDPANMNDALQRGLSGGASTLIFLLAVLLIFYVIKAPYSLWIEQGDEIRSLQDNLPTLSKRCSLIDFLNYASGSGWNLENDSSSALDLLDGLRQAGFDGAIMFFGRPKSAFRNGTMREPISPIPKAYWRSAELNLHSVFKFENSRIVAIAANNANTSTSKPGNDEDYLDIHLEVKRARLWLRDEADNFVGKNKAISQS